MPRMQKYNQGRNWKRADEPRIKAAYRFFLYTREADLMKVNTSTLINSMNKKGINQRQLAEGAGVQNYTVSRIINGKLNPHISTVGKIAAFLGCEVSELCAEVVR